MPLHIHQLTMSATSSRTWEFSQLRSICPSANRCNAHFFAASFHPQADPEKKEVQLFGGRSGVPSAMM